MTSSPLFYIAAIACLAVLVVLALVALLLASRLGGPGVRGAGKGIAPAPRRQSSGLARYGALTLALLAGVWLVAPHLSLLEVSFVPIGA